MGMFLHEGRRLFYREHGSGLPVLILPGNTASSAHHAADLERLGQRYHVYAFDAFGCGGSERADVWPLDWWALAARDSAALMRAEGYTQWATIGTSGGAVTALWQAIQFPEAVACVVADSCTDGWTLPAMQQVIATRNQKLPEQIAFWRSGHGDDWEQVVDADSNLMLRFAESGGDWFGGRLAAVRCPALLTGSFHDGAIPHCAEDMLRMARQMPAAALHLSHLGDHPFMWAAADAFYAEVEPFLAAHLTAA